MQWKNNTTAKEVYLTPFQFHSDARERRRPRMVCHSIARFNSILMQGKASSVNTRGVVLLVSIPF